MRVPASTYRLQITEDFDLIAAARTLAYLHDLGVDWVYLSPLLASESGSEHGYDVADHRAIDPSRGRSSGLAALATEARRLGMGVLVDIVPNHVGVAQPWENEWWWNVLTHGQESSFAGAFDIDWAAGGGRVRIPVVADDDVLPDGRLGHLRVLGGELHYHDQRFPLAPGSVHGAEEDPDAVHARQHYELIDWREADHSLNYRRFFAINSLIAIRVEDAEWFDRSHAEIRRWFDEGLVDGLRVDHPDGLRDPGRYLDDLASLTGGAYVLVEKILALRQSRDAHGRVALEELPSSWATAGTTGYEALALIDRVLVDPAGEEPLTALEERLRGRHIAWPVLVHDGKLAVAEGMLNSEVRRIAREVLGVLGAAASETPEIDRLSAALAELLAGLDVYRTYLPEGREHLERAFADARRRRPDLSHLFDLLAPVLTDGASGPALRFQQTSGMVMAKGVEDAAFYRWSRLTSLNEVGGDPDVFAVGVGTFHALMAARQASWPSGLTAGTTHDTKRGEDVRARISVLAELPGLWADGLNDLLGLVPLPDPGFGNLLWQAILGAWPADRERLRGYAEKAMREAGEHTSWTEPDEAHEASVLAAVDAAFDDPRVRAVLDRLCDAVVAPGWSNALAAKLLDLTIPGVPDLYQGSELWELSLVDPDNRRAVDFDHRTRLLAEVRTGERPPRPTTAEDAGAAKLLLSHLALTARRDHSDWFTGYTPLDADGPAAGHVVAFDRGGAIAVATRLPVGLDADGGWRDTVLTLPGGRWRDALTGRVVAVDDHGATRLGDLLASYPVALLLRDERRPGERGRFDVWAPDARRVRLVAGERRVEMVRDGDGWWRPDGPEPLGRVDYGYLLDERPVPLPDPRSRWQPHGVHGLSRTVQPTGFAWTDQAWTGRPLAGGVLYGLHVGSFTPEGTLDAAIARLPELVDLGVDFVELAPVSSVGGEAGWGYDGVGWFAVHEPYGGPDAYRRFVDAAHSLGLAVIQDVVYHPLGPVGDHLRRCIADNLRFWFTDMHVDALGLDVPVDRAEVSLIEDLAVVTADAAAHLRRPLALIAKQNDPRLITPRESGGFGLDAVWNDDFGHALDAVWNDDFGHALDAAPHPARTDDQVGPDTGFGPLAALAACCERGPSRDRAEPTSTGGTSAALDVETTPGWRLVVSSSSHEVGDRVAGARPGEVLDDGPADEGLPGGVLDDDQLAVAALITLTTPFTPWLSGRHPTIEGVHRELVALRREYPELNSPALTSTACTFDEDARWFCMRRGGLAVVANFGASEVSVELGGRHRLRWATRAGASVVGTRVVLPPHAGALLLPVAD